MSTPHEENFPLPLCLPTSSSPLLLPLPHPTSLQTREDTHDGKIFACIVSRSWKFLSQGKEVGGVVYSSRRFLRFRFFSFVRTGSPKSELPPLERPATLVIEFASFSRDRTISSSSSASSSFTLFFVEGKLGKIPIFLPVVQLVGNIGL